MPKFTVELCYTVPYYVEVAVEAEDADDACNKVYSNAERYEEGFEPCHEATGDTYVSECVEHVDGAPPFDRVADAPFDANRPIHPDFRSNDQNTAAARDKLYALVEELAKVETWRSDANATMLLGFVTKARDLIGWIPGEKPNA